MGFQRFKSKRRAVPSAGFTTGAIRLADDRRHVALPVLGTIKTHANPPANSAAVPRGVPQTGTGPAHWCQPSKRWRRANDRRNRVHCRVHGRITETASVAL